MNEKKFDPKKLQKLNNPQRLIDIPPDYIQSKLTVGDPDVLVDIGAGTAFFSIAFLKQLHPASIYACDQSETMVSWMQENVSPDHPEIMPVKSMENSIPLDTGFADLVFMIALHHELENPLQILQESFRLLKTGGEIFIVDWKKQDMPDGPPQEIRCVAGDVAEQMAAAGYGNVKIFDEMPKHFLVVGKKI